MKKISFKITKEINGEPMFVQAIYKKVEKATTTKNILDLEKV